MSKTFYITTPIYYVNDVPHIGHAYTTLAADVLARYHRLAGYNVFFLTGTDEHGQKIEKAAREHNETPQQLADRVVERFKELWRLLNISNDDFIRTSESRHRQAVWAFFKRAQKQGDIYKGEYEDWYCIPCETFLTEFQLQAGRCPTCGRPVEKIKEESYFFRMSRYQKKLLGLLRKDRKFIQPQSRYNEIVSFVREGLRDLSVSRTGLKWGIPVPFDDRHVIYVWFDALTNYLTAVGYPGKTTFKKFWPADVHLIGKDILRFHAVYWPTFLMSAGLPLPKKIFAHGWWTVDGEKMSKSKGNVVDPAKVVQEFGVDAFRYFLFREVPFGLDGDFSREAVLNRYNNDLANDLGNLLSRTLTMIAQYAGGDIPRPHRTGGILKETAESVSGKVDRAMKELAFHQALNEIWRLVLKANQFIEKSAPWKLAKEPRHRQKLESVLYASAETLRLLSLYLFPFMPKTAEKMAAQLGLRPDRLFAPGGLKREIRWGGLKAGVRTSKAAGLFPRMDRPPKTAIKEKAQELDAGSQPPARGMRAPAGPEDLKRDRMQRTQIDIEEFRRLDLRVGRIVSAERIPGSEKLLRLIVDLGTEQRQIVAGMAPKYTPQGLVGQKVIVVANLKPARLMGTDSQGMILAAGDREVLALATFLEDVPPGTPIR